SAGGGAAAAPPPPEVASGGGTASPGRRRSWAASFGGRAHPRPRGGRARGGRHDPPTRGTPAGTGRPAPPGPRGAAQGGRPAGLGRPGRGAPGETRAAVPDVDLNFDVEEAVARLMRFLAVEGVTGQEKAIGEEVVRALAEAGVPRKAMRFDRARERIPL